MPSPSALDSAPLWAHHPGRAAPVAKGSPHLTRLLPRCTIPGRTASDVAGLQEVSLWETGPIGGPLSPSYDFLELLLAALARHGLTYRPVATNVNFASDPTPISTTTAARLTDRDVIIARTGLPSSRLR